EANSSLSIYNNKSFNLSRDNYYQLSNRIAYSWKLASMGIPVILIYLGFINDTDVGTPFENHSAWEGHIKSHINNIFPIDLLCQNVDCGSSIFKIIIRSIDINNNYLVE